MKFQRILIGIDDGQYAENAAQYGFELAHQFKAQVALVHITEPIIMTQTSDPSMAGTLMPNLAIDEPEVLNIQEEHSGKLIENISNKYAGDLLITQYNEFGSTADGIMDCIAKFNADLVVLGTHSRTGLDRFFMGSVAEEIVRHSPVPVLVVPLKTEDHQ